ncbi:1-deoxy-D-xylulose-5-phosphate reductoisomerase [Gammaproteobacteria bacterium]|jgi:1-deoxy-D-xylulose-5-phosphate reductoisomerase|nr:1-deoxy-D-xylulose-5-phosphate reductoisomerase [Gammaproteobacteria bacterium]MDB0002864.1 1-deoxy-D-xylulose-5-phosphate reductoisomerase [Gammaproteobacteria bacterium]MDB2448112.1 1-deoxy-D-xylulose-5-phosphate reductoisomerase [Gammaproteobacteria bacterium]MDB2503813.1 1-deoxy-D-xylulose-5-phosphate reductoisomerase [Gammaproteobacteria bacterium]MDC0348628.1 1-deoxy-D-xylulose-5-phosphate reductoisomerase [Gammaproteobacteria bacterium]
MKNILLLGATGSIGDSVLSVIKQNSDELNLVGIAFQSNTTKAISIIEEFDPNYAYCESKVNLNIINDSLKKSEGIELLNNKSELEYLLNHKSIDIIISAISGFSGLETTFMAAQSGKIILLANKESIVVAGDIILPLAKKHNTKIIPIDSEHNAIFQCLNSEKNTDDVSKIIITASGGPFLNKKVDDLSGVTKREALNHPNWKMGSKITIDSATLVNKCLELIEAKYLFNLNEEYFELVVHPQSIIHSIVTYKDGSSICQMSNPDMRVPISHALSLEESRLSLNFSEINFSSLNLTFQEFPKDRLEIANLAREVCNTRGSTGTVFNAANEIAVENFLSDNITFNKIYEVIYRTFNAIPVSKNIDIEAIHEIDNQTRMEAQKVVKSLT